MTCLHFCSNSYY